MQSDEKQKILELLKDRPDLICSMLFRRSFEEVVKILQLPYWSDSKFQPLLTSNIW